MRTEKEIMELILNTAQNDDRVRAVYMNGSRTNPKAPKDVFQDYDIVYVVSETASFIADEDWPSRFGEILIMQYPDESPFCPNDKEHSYGWLMIFTDGNRIDLTVKTVDAALADVVSDSLCQILLDKDNILPQIPESSDIIRHVKKPTEKEYFAVCNEYWWCLTYIAKGLWRKEVTYAQDIMNRIVRKQLEKMLTWKVGLLTDHSVSVGKSGKYLHKWLSESEWKAYLDTYSNADIDSMWKAVDKMNSLFIDTAKYVAEGNGLIFNQKEADNSLYFIGKVRVLPETATDHIL